MTASDDVLDLVQRWAAAEQQNDAGPREGLLAEGFAGVGPLGFALTPRAAAGPVRQRPGQPLVYDRGPAGPQL